MKTIARRQFDRFLMTGPAHIAFYQPNAAFREDPVIVKTMRWLFGTIKALTPMR